MKTMCFAVVLAVGSMTGTAISAELSSVSLWANPRLFGKPGKYEVSEHPCGGAVVISTSFMPQYDRNADLIPDRVFEISERGEQLHFWRTPIDTTPVAIQGDRLLVQDNSYAYWISISGEVETVPLLNEPESNENFKSKDLVKRIFEDPGSVWLLRTRDLSSSKLRILAYEGVCS